MCSKVQQKHLKTSESDSTQKNTPGVKFPGPESSVQVRLWGFSLYDFVGFICFVPNRFLVGVPIYRVKTWRNLRDGPGNSWVYRVWLESVNIWSKRVPKIACDIDSIISMSNSYGSLNYVGFIDVSYRSDIGCRSCIKLHGLLLVWSTVCCYSVFYNFHPDVCLL